MRWNSKNLFLPILPCKRVIVKNFSVDGVCVLDIINGHVSAIIAIRNVTIIIVTPWDLFDMLKVTGLSESQEHETKWLSLAFSTSLYNVEGCAILYSRLNLC